MKIAIDLMGSEIFPQSLFNACFELEKKLKPQKISFIYIGTEEITHPADVHFITAKNFITLEEAPLLALRSKKDSSLEIGLKLLKQKKADAFISAGNTGALMSCAKMNLPMLPLISRPALLALLPNKSKNLVVIDVGANISYKAKYLIEHALIAISFQKVFGNKIPSLGLLNIGAEAQKGTLEIKKAYSKLKEIAEKTKSFTFIGNIEGKEVFEGKLDILVTDGFTGNIFLKTAEGFANFLLDQLTNELASIKSSFNKPFFDYSQKYPGALLCGIEGLVIKCHSYASISSFVNSIKEALSFLETDLTQSLKKNLLSFDL